MNLKDLSGWLKLPDPVDQNILITADNGAESAGTPDVTGGTIDTQVLGGVGQFGGCVILITTTSVTGSPTSFEAKFYLQESADDSVWTKVDGYELDIVAANSGGKLNIPPHKLRQRYVRWACEITLTGGSTPALSAAGIAILVDTQHAEAAI